VTARDSSFHWWASGVLQVGARPIGWRDRLRQSREADVGKLQLVDIFTETDGRRPWSAQGATQARKL
jgi:hypothetical protein